MPQVSPNVVVLSAEERTNLEATARRYTAPHAEVVRAKLVIPRQTVSRWRKRFCEHRLEGLRDQPRSGRPAAFSPRDNCGGEGGRV
jgi:transposase